MKYCHRCSLAWEEPSEPGSRKTCNKCLTDLHVCLNCKFYNTSRSNQCEVNDVEAIVDKEKANYCEEFQFADRPVPSKQTKIPNSREAFDKLFKNNK